MFGYVRPRKDQLRLCDYDRYRAAYCGLCRALGKQYGFRYRFFVNYDMTFLYFLLAGTEKEAECKKCVCPANVFRRRACYLSDETYRIVAAADVILCHWQLCDAVQDRSFWKSLPYRLIRTLTNRGYRKAAALAPEFDALAAEELERLAALEKENCASIDKTADCFATILQGCAAHLKAPELRRPTEQVLYHVGRFLYLADALDDLRSDCASSSYNPLRFRYTVHDGTLREADLAELTQTMEHSVCLAGAALELLPPRSGREILENIIYLGLPAVLQAVKNGNFRARAKI